MANVEKNSSGNKDIIITIPKGEGVYRTEYYLEKGNKLYFKSLSQKNAVLWDEQHEKEKVIPPKGVNNVCTKEGYLEFVKQKTETRILFKMKAR